MKGHIPYTYIDSKKKKQVCLININFCKTMNKRNRLSLLSFLFFAKWVYFRQPA